MKKLLSVLDFLLLGFVGFCLVHPSQHTAEGLPTRQVSVLWYVAAAVVALGLTLLIAWLDSRFDFRRKLLSSLRGSGFTIAVCLILLLASAAVGAMAEWCVSRFVGVMSTGDTFNIYRFFLFTEALFVLSYFVCCLIRKELKAENMVLALVLSAGLTIIFAAPFGHLSWDNESHYRMALNTASLYGDVSAADAAVANQPVSAYFRIDFTGTNAAGSEACVDALNEMEDTDGGETVSRKTSVAHILPGFVAAVCRVLGVSFHARYNLMRIANLLLYAAVVYFAVKRLKTGKMIMAVIALLPTVIFATVNLSYDGWVVGFLLLGMAYFFSEQQQPDKYMTAGQSAAMCLFLAIGCLPKETYLPILLLPLFLKKDYFSLYPEEKRRHRRICLLSLLLVILAFGLRTVIELRAGGDMRGGEGINATGQILYVLTHPFSYLGTLGGFLRQYLTWDKTKDLSVFFVYLDYIGGHTICMLLLFVAVITDKNEYDVYSSGCGLRFATIGNFLLCVVICASAMYVAFTPVGSETINGCQPRYMVPALFPMLANISTSRIRNLTNRNWYHALFGFGMGIVLFAGIYTNIISVML